MIKKFKKKSENKTHNKEPNSNSRKHEVGLVRNITDSLKFRGLRAKHKTLLRKYDNNNKYNNKKYPKEKEIFTYPSEELQS